MRPLAGMAAAEQEAVCRYLGCLGAEVLAAWPHPAAADQCLGCVAAAGEPLALHLAVWDVAGRAVHARHFAAFVLAQTAGMNARRMRFMLVNPWWGGARPRGRGMAVRA